MACRIIYDNFIMRAGAVLTPSSEVTSLPRAALLRPLRSDVLRFQAGYDIRSNENDRIDFNRGGNKTATIAAGHYATPALLAAAVVVALEAADATPVWACAWVAGIFTISSDLAFTLRFSTGSNKARSAHLDMGYTSTDKGSATSQAAEGASYQSRRVLFIDVGAGGVGAGVTIGATNNKLDFDRGGAKVATIASAFYATGAALATAVQAALVAADAVPAWAVTYSADAFSIDAPATSFGLLFGTGANRLVSIHTVLGYENVDIPAGAAPYTSHFTPANFSTIPAMTIGAVLGGNISATGTVRLDGLGVSLVGGGPSGAIFGYDAPLGAASKTLVAEGLVAFPATSRRYLRLLISDVSNPATYSELAVLFAGAELDIGMAPSGVASPVDHMGFDVNVVDEREELSDVVFAIGGAQHQISRPARKVWHLNLHAIDDAKKVELETFAAAVKLGGCFFFDFAGDGTNVRYVFMDRGMAFQAQETIPRTWNVELQLKESLG